MIGRLTNYARKLPVLALYQRWPRRYAGQGKLREGYTIVLPAPADMPFLARIALESFRGLDLRRCQGIYVVPDRHEPETLDVFRGMVREHAELAATFVELGWREKLGTRSLGPFAICDIHWLAMITGAAHSDSRYVFLHDADAFFAEAGGIERQYDEAVRRGMDTLGVTARIDPEYVKKGMSIPGTWELMFSTAWARSMRPLELRGRSVRMADGRRVFDTMLCPQYRQWDGGKIGVMGEPPRFVHFNGTIVTYRAYERAGGRPVCDEMFRVLLLSMLEEVFSPPGEARRTPGVETLARGLTDERRAVHYTGERAGQEYPEFRRTIEKMLACPVFTPERAGRVREMLEPFDKHFRPGERTQAYELRYRSDGLGAG